MVHKLFAVNFKMAFCLSGQFPAVAGLCIADRVDATVAVDKVRVGGEEGEGLAGPEYEGHCGGRSSSVPFPNPYVNVAQVASDLSALSSAP